MRNSVLHSALRQVRDQIIGQTTLAVLASVALILALSGPFGTILSLSLAWRLAYWGSVVPLTFLAGAFGSALVGVLMAGRPLWMRLPMISLASALLVWVVLMVLHTALGFSFARLANAATELPLLFLMCFVIEGTREVIVHQRPDQAPAPEAPPPPPRLLERLPEGLRGDLINLSVKDHYVSVSTTLGTHDLLMRLSDAITEVGPVAGMQVHRSHWVATAQVIGGRRTADQAVLQMSNGAQIPVSRANLKAVEAAGLFSLPATETEPGKGRQGIKARAADIGQSLL